MVKVICPLLKKKKKCYILHCLHSIICKYRQVKLGQNIYVQQNLNEFNHGSNSRIYKYKPISTKLGQNEYEHRSQMSLIMGQVIPDQSVLSALEIEKLNFGSLFGIYFHC